MASQAALALGTQPFGEVLNELQSRNGQVEAPEFAQLFVEKSKEQALSELHSPALAAFDASALGRLGDAVSKLQTSCMENGVSPEQLRECLAQAVKIDFAQEPRRVELTDLGSLTEVMSQKLSPRAVKKAAQKVREQLRQTVLAEQHSTPEQEGFLSKLVRRLPFLVGPQRSLEGATGLTVFWAPQESERLKMIAESQYGREHPLNEFMSYLGS